MAPRPPRLAGLILLAALLLVAAASSGAGAVADGVFQVRSKFHGGANISAFRDHDRRRHGRLLAAADIPLGGLGLPTDIGLYYTEVELGTPPKRYLVEVDTGNSKLEVNCISCENCPHKSLLYDHKASSSGSTVSSCDQKLCLAIYGEPSDPYCNASEPCTYMEEFDDGSYTIGIFVTDVLPFHQVTGDGQTQPVNATMEFGCITSIRDGDSGSSNQVLDGTLGFGPDNMTMLSQLAAAGKVEKKFVHCLDTVKGGGIFAIGNVVQPKVKTTPLLSSMFNYNVNLKTIDVGGTTLDLDDYDFNRTGKTIIDSGTTMTYLPELMFTQVMDLVFQHQDISFHNVQNFSCFHYSGSVDDGFQTITFHFEDNLALHVYPHQYFFPNGKDIYCMGFQNGALHSNYLTHIVVMGGLVLSNKLVVYDLENQVIGWTDYNCSSSIKIKDDKTGTSYTINSHGISSPKWNG